MIPIIDQKLRGFAFAPHDAYKKRADTTDEKIDNKTEIEEKIEQIKEGFIYAGYLAATGITLLCAGLIGLAAILTYPVPFIVAAVFDGFDWASDLVDEWSSKENQIKI